MPGTCFCSRCERFRTTTRNRLSVKSVQAMEKVNMPSNDSRRARIKRGEGKNGGKKV